jgi:hypothetical protein
MWQLSMIFTDTFGTWSLWIEAIFSEMSQITNPNPGELMDNEEFDNLIFDNHQITKSVSVLCHHPNVASASPL